MPGSRSSTRGAIPRHRRGAYTDTSTDSRSRRRVHGYLDGQSVETIWWSREFAEEHFDTPGSDQALLHGVALRTSGLLARWHEQLAVYPDELATERIEKATERWGGFSPGGLLTIARPDTELARAEWLVESAQRVLAIIYALNREGQPTAKRLAANTASLAVTPDRIEEALVETDPHRALLTMAELQLDTVNLAPDGPNVVRARRWLAQAVELLRAATTR